MNLERACVFLYHSLAGLVQEGSKPRWGVGRDLKTSPERAEIGLTAQVTSEYP